MHTSAQFWQQRRQAGAAAQPVPTEEDITLTDNAIEVKHADVGGGTPSASISICCLLQHMLQDNLLMMMIFSPAWQFVRVSLTVRQCSLVQKLQELCQGQTEQCLRLTVEAGGCSGFSYKFDMDNKIQEGDR